MVRADSWYVLRRLQDLQGWADYIAESLTQDQRFEQGKREVMERLIEANVLRELRDLSERLRDRLHTVTTDLASSRAEKAAV